MAHRIELTRYAVTEIDWQSYGTYRMRVEVTAVEGDGLDPYLFIYQRLPQSPYIEQACDDFVALAGPAQVADVPIGEPDANRSYPFFRLSWIELDFTSEALAMEVWTIIQREAKILCEAMGRFTQMQRVEDVWVPDAPADTPSVSESASESLSE